jgi:hypothetical protein
VPLGEIFRIREVRAPIIVQKHLFTEPPSRSPNEFFKPLLDQGDGFASETAEQRFQMKRTKWNCYVFNGNSPTDVSVRSGVTAM